MFKPTAVVKKEARWINIQQAFSNFVAIAKPKQLIWLNELYRVDFLHRLLPDNR